LRPTFEKFLCGNGPSAAVAAIAGIIRTLLSVSLTS